MSDKVKIIRLYTYLKYVYFVGSIFFIFSGLFVPIMTQFFFTGVALYIFPASFILMKLFTNGGMKAFTHGGREYTLMCRNVKSYGPSSLIGMLGLILMPISGLVMYYIFKQNFYTSAFIGLGFNCLYWTVFSTRHIASLNERESISIE